MAHIILKRGTSTELANESLQDGTLSFTTDDGRIHIDYKDKNNQLVRKTLYGGTLTIGPYTFNGTEDVTVNMYEGVIKEE